MLYEKIDYTHSVCYALAITEYDLVQQGGKLPPIARFMGPTWDPSGTDRAQVVPMLAPWTLLSGSLADTNIVRS